KKTVKASWNKIPQPTVLAKNQMRDFYVAMAEDAVAQMDIAAFQEHDGEISQLQQTFPADNLFTISTEIKRQTLWAKYYAKKGDHNKLLETIKKLEIHWQNNQKVANNCVKNEMFNFYVETARHYANHANQKRFVEFNEKAESL